MLFSKSFFSESSTLLFDRAVNVVKRAILTFRFITFGLDTPSDSTNQVGRKALFLLSFYAIR